jgi:hypothetical protein
VSDQGSNSRSNSSSFSFLSQQRRLPGPGGYLSAAPPAVGWRDRLQQHCPWAEAHAHQHMGHSPRGNKLLPVFYGGQYPVNRGTLPRTRSPNYSPSHSPTRRGFSHHHSSSRMGILRLLVMLGMGLLVVSLMYVQVCTRACAGSSTPWLGALCRPHCICCTGCDVS